MKGEAPRQRIAEAAEHFGMSESDLRSLAGELGIPISRQADDSDVIEVSPLLRLAIRSRSDVAAQELRWASLAGAVTSSGRATPTAAAPPQSQQSTIRSLVDTTLGFITALAAITAAAATCYLAWLAHSELARAIDAFRIASQYSFGNDLISSVEPFLLQQPDGVVVVTDERIGLALSLQERGAFPDGFWSAHRAAMCSAIRESICPSVDDTAYIIRVEKYENIVRACFEGVEAQQDLCEMEF